MAVFSWMVWLVEIGNFSPADGCDVSSCEPNKLWNLRVISTLVKCVRFQSSGVFCRCGLTVQRYIHMFMPHQWCTSCQAKNMRCCCRRRWIPRCSASLEDPPPQLPLPDAKEAVTRSPLNFAGPGCLFMQVERMVRFKNAVIQGMLGLFWSRV